MTVAGEPAPTTPESHKRWMFYVFPIVAMVVVVIAIFVIRAHQQPKVITPAFVNPLTDVTGDVSFPLYYPSSLPAGMQYQTGSVSTRGGVVNFNLTYGGGKQLIIAEQPMPKVLEQVTHTKDFDTPIGKAYIADVNGHTAGFIQAKSTLLVLSNWQSDSSDSLQQLMTNMQLVKQ